MFWRPVAVVGRTRRRSSQDSSVSQEGKRLGLRVAAPFPELFLGRDPKVIAIDCKNRGGTGFPSSQRRVSSHSVKTIRRRSFHSLRDKRLSLIQRTSHSTRASGFNAAASALASISLTAASSVHKSPAEASLAPRTEAASAVASSSASIAFSASSSSSPRSSICSVVLPTNA